jgi:hypothetical protein
MSPNCDGALKKRDLCTVKLKEYCRNVRGRWTGGSGVTRADEAMYALGSEFRVGTRYLKQQLSSQGVTVALPDSCLEAFVRNAHETTVRSRHPSEAYVSCLRQHLEARARFISLWTGSDSRLDEAPWAELIAIAQQYALPRRQESV